MGKLECLRKEYIEKSVEEAPPQADRSKEDKGNGVMEEPQKKRTMSYSSYGSSKFITTVSHSAKPVVPPTPKLLEASMKATKERT